MAYDEYQADRIRQSFARRQVAYEEKKMMGGLAFMVDEKMCIGLMQDKATREDRLMCRVGKEAYEQALQEKGAMPMDFTGRPLSGFIYVRPEGFDNEEDFENWVQKCLDFNPFAKSSKKRKKK